MVAHCYIQHIPEISFFLPFSFSPVGDTDRCGDKNSRILRDFSPGLHELSETNSPFPLPPDKWTSKKMEKRKGARRKAFVDVTRRDVRFNLSVAPNLRSVFADAALSAFPSTSSGRVDTPDRANARRILETKKRTASLPSLVSIKDITLTDKLPSSTERSGIYTKLVIFYFYYRVT